MISAGYSNGGLLPNDKMRGKLFYDHVRQQYKEPESHVVTLHPEQKETFSNPVHINVKGIHKQEGLLFTLEIFSSFIRWQLVLELELVLEKHFESIGRLDKSPLKFLKFSWKSLFFSIFHFSLYKI